MPYYHTTLSFFMGRYGWRERFYVSAASAAQALSLTRHLATARLPLLASAVSLGRVVTAQENLFRAVLETGVAPIRQPTGDLTPWNAVRITLQAERYSRQYLLRGLPANAFVSNDAGLPTHLTAAWIPPVRKWLELLVSLRFRLKVKDRSQPWHPIIGAAPVAVGDDADLLGRAIRPDTLPPGQGFLLLAAKDDTTWPLNDELGERSRIDVAGIKWTTGKKTLSGMKYAVNGTHAIQGIDAGGRIVTVTGGYPEGDGTYDGGGKMRLRQWLYVPITSAIIKEAAKRNTGRCPGKYAIPYDPGLPDYGVAPADVPAPITAPSAAQVTPQPAQPPASVPGPYPGARLVRTGRQLCAIAYEGYPDLPPFTTLPISIYKIESMQNAYLIACSGTDSTWNFKTGYPADFGASFSVPFGFPNSIIKAVKDARVPKDALLFGAGHSLGGMALQVAAVSPGSGIRLTSLVTFGSPLVHGGPPGYARRMFATNFDPVTKLGATAGIYGLVGQPEQTYVSNAPFDKPPKSLNPYEWHRHYQELDSLDDYDFFGSLAEQPPGSGNFHYTDVWIKLVYTVRP